MSKLSGIVQIDETFFRETQKGSRNLESTVKGEIRKPRYGRRPSKYGVMGNEFANVVCMTDLKGYTVSKVIGLGKLTIETFTELFDDYLDNPSFICSDGNSVYKNYCDLKNIPLYVRPSNYLDVIHKNGYETPDWSNPSKAKATEEKNNKILSKLYYENLIDHVYNRDDLSYKEFVELKNANSLSLARVNQFHNELKRHFERNTKGVNTKYLQDYIGFYTFIRNWKITNGHYPSSHKDAEAIFIEILRGKTTYTRDTLGYGFCVTDIDFILKNNNKILIIEEKKGKIHNTSTGQNLSRKEILKDVIKDCYNKKYLYVEIDSSEIIVEHINENKMNKYKTTPEVISEIIGFLGGVL